MSVKLGALLNSLLLKSGIKSDHPELINLLSKSELANVEIPKDFSEALEKNLLTPESALAHQNVRSTLIAQALNGIDSELEAAVDDLGFDEDVKASIKGIKGNTNERMRQFKAETKKLIEKATKQAGKGDVEQANKTIQDLNSKLAEMSRTKQSEIESLANSHRSTIKDLRLEALLSQKSYPNKDLPKEVNLLTARQLIDLDLSRKGYVLDLDESGRDFKLTTKEGTDVFVNNKQVLPTDYFDAVLAENKFVAVNEPAPQREPAPQGYQSSSPNPRNAAIVAEIERDLGTINQ